MAVVFMSCENCEAMHDRLVAALEAQSLKDDQVLDLQRKVNALKAEASKQRADSPKMVDAKEVFDLWVQLLGKNRRTTFGPARQKAVIARLSEDALGDTDRKADLAKAVKGMALVPFVGPQGRQATDSQAAKRHDDLALVCRDETTVERFMGYVDEQAAAGADYRAGLPAKAKGQALDRYGENTESPGRPRWYGGTLEVLIRALEDHGCTVRWHSHSGRGSAQCPAHEDRSPSLSLKEEGNGKVLLHCFAGCETGAVLAALGTSWADLAHAVGPESYRSGPPPAGQRSFEEAA